MDCVPSGSLTVGLGKPPAALGREPGSTIGSGRSVAWSADGKRVVAAGAAIQSWDAQTGAPQWVALPFEDGMSVTFAPTGQILSGDLPLLEKEFAFFIETPTGAMELLSPSQFAQRVAAAAQPQP